MTISGFGISFGGDENVLKSIVVLVTQLHEHAKNHSVVYFKMVNCMIYELYLNTAIIKNKGIT